MSKEKNKQKPNTKKKELYQTLMNEALRKWPGNQHKAQRPGSVCIGA